MILPAIAAGVGVAVIVMSADPFIVRAQDAAPEAVQSAPQPAAEPAPPPDPAAELAAKRDQTRAELETLSKTISLSTDKVSTLQQSIADLEKSTESIRQALIDSAARRKALEKQILESEKKLADLGVKEDGIRRSLHERRGLLAEVLAALQRMGRNPPPALLVTPDDALQVLPRKPR
jgi:septal ring factor EnvC (AmiA/AmiB activator)